MSKLQVKKWIVTKGKFEGYIFDGFLLTIDNETRVFNTSLDYNSPEMDEAKTSFNIDKVSEV